VSIRESVLVGEQLSLPATGVRTLDVSAEQAGSLAALAIDATLIVLTSLVTGTAYQRIALGVNGDLTVMLGTGAVVAAAFCAITRLSGAADPLRVSSGLGRATGAITAWTSTFLFLVLLAFALKVSAGFSRGSIFSFFVAGLGVTVGSRVLAPPCTLAMEQGLRIPWRRSDHHYLRRLRRCGCAHGRTSPARLHGNACRRHRCGM